MNELRSASPVTLTRGNENVEHEARAPGWFYTDAISDQSVAYIDEHTKRHAGTLHDLASRKPERANEMAAQYEAWAKRSGVLDREKIATLMKSQGVTRAFWEKDET